MATDPEPKKPRSLAGLSFTTAAPAPVGSLVEVPHVHGPGCDHGHDHDHDAPPVERGPTTRTCSGQSAIQLDLAFFLPGETDDRGRFEQIARELARLPGVVSTHLRRDAAHLEICAHVDPAVAVEVAAVRTVVARASKRYLGKTWFVRGMDSAQCGYVIEHVLRRTPGILSADVAYAAERVVIEYDATVLDEAAIERKVAAVGYELETPSAGHACSHHAHSGGLAPALEMPLTLGAGALLALGFGLPYVLAAPALVPTGLFAVALCLAGFYPARDAIAALRAGRLDIEALMVLAAIGAGALGAWFEGAFLLFLFSLGHTLEHRAMDRARHAVEALAALRPPTAWVRRASGLVETDVAQVVRGDVVVVRPGDRVPLDGTVVAGASQLDQAAITGESVPVPKSVGDGVFAGTVNFDGTLDVRVDKLSTESALARVVDLVAEAEARKSPAQRFTARVERIFVPVVIVGAPLFAVGLWLWGLPVQDAVLRGLSVLVAASPCALAISTPAAVLSAVARAAKGGVLIKGGAHLEALGATRVIAFDKTGTLTVGRPSLVEVVPLALGEAELVALAAGAESLSSHPLAAAIVAAAEARGLTVTAGADVQAVHGRGLRAVVGGRKVEVGNEGLFDGVPAAVAEIVDRMRTAGRTVAVVRVDGAYAGVLGLSDTPRPEAAEVVRALHALGVTRTVMLSGDHQVVARAVATSLGLSEHRAPLMPEDKVRACKDLMRDGAVAMVGDGVNDAPALAAASVGVAMGGAGSDTALETADVVLMSDDLRKLPFAIQLARSANAVVRQNIVIALGVAAVLVVASVFGWVQIAHAVVLHEGSTLVVVANGLRLLAWRAR